MFHIMFLASENLSSLPGISHGFFTRNGGVSSGIYGSLNGGMGSGDNPAYVMENRRRIAERLGAPANHLLSLHQIHSADVITVTGSWGMEKRPMGDALVTDRRGITLAVLTADCVPVLFADRKSGIIGAAHAGWKGAFSGVLERTLEAMAALGAEREFITCAIGPAIAQPSYEVGVEFRETFLRKSSHYSRYFTPSRKAEHFLFNLKRFVYDTLSGAGVRDINMLENDTYLEEDAFFSYRRATHRAEADYGRQVSAIMLKGY